jgi:hypothetical protein
MGHALKGGFAHGMVMVGRSPAPTTRQVVCVL